MASPSLGTAYVQIQPKAEGIKGAISKVLGGEAESAGTSVGGKLGTFIKRAIVAAGIGTAVVKGVKAAMAQGAELEQNIGGAYAVFGNKLYGTLEKQATQAYKNMGMSASDYYATANKMGSLFQGSGISQKKSLDLTTSAMQRAADVASVMGLDTSAAMESIAGAAKGNFTMMDNLGVAMNATTLEAYALEKGMNFKWNTASNAEKAELAMQMFMDRTSQYAGNFARESDETFSGSLGSMKAAYQDFLGSIALGENVGESMNNLVTTASTFFFGNFLPMLGTIIKSLPGAIWTFLSQGIPTLLSNVSNLVNTFASNIGNLANGLTGEKVAAWVSATIPKIISGAGNVMGKFITGLLNALPKIVSAIGRIGLAIITGLGSAIWPKITAAANGIKEKFLAPINALKEKVKGIIDKIKGFFKFNVPTPHIPKPTFSISPAGWKLGDLLKGSIPHLNITWAAKGGIVDNTTLIGAGEAGAEAIVPLDPFWKKLEQMGNSQSNEVTINVYASEGMSVTELASEVERRLISATNRRRLAWQ